MHAYIARHHPAAAASLPAPELALTSSAPLPESLLESAAKEARTKGFFAAQDDDDDDDDSDSDSSSSSSSSESDEDDEDKLQERELASTVRSSSGSDSGKSVEQKAELMTASQVSISSSVEQSPS